MCRLPAVKVAHIKIMRILEANAFATLHPITFYPNLRLPAMLAHHGFELRDGFGRQKMLDGIGIAINALRARARFHTSKTFPTNDGAAPRDSLRLIRAAVSRQRPSLSGCNQTACLQFAQRVRKTPAHCAAFAIVRLYSAKVIRTICAVTIHSPAALRPFHTNRAAYFRDAPNGAWPK